MIQRRHSFLLWTLVCLHAQGAEYQADLVSWLHRSAPAMVSQQDTGCCATLFQSATTSLAHLTVAPGGIRYAILAWSPSAQSVEIRDFTGGKTLSVYTNEGKLKNKFSPLDVIWSPDADSLYVRYGYSDIGGGAWFRHDSKTGKMMGDAAHFDMIKELSVARRTDSVRYEEPAPVWTLGGKEFKDERAAADAGYTALYSPWRYNSRGEIQYSTHVRWTDGRTYTLLLEAEHDRWLVRVIADEKLLDTLNPVVAPVYQGVLFTVRDRHLMAYILNSGPKRQGFGVVDFGVRKLERVMDLGPIGVLVQSTDTSTRYWQILNPRKVTESG